MPVNVNVVPGDVAAGRISDPIVRAERLILEAQTAKSLAVDELRNGKIKEASGRLKGTAANLRREASLIPVTDERSAESLAIIRAEADEIETLGTNRRTRGYPVLLKAHDRVLLAQNALTQCPQRTNRSIT
jgi:Ca-activated chloride channel homolog